MNSITIKCFIFLLCLIIGKFCFAQVERPVHASLVSNQQVPGRNITNSGTYNITEPLFNISHGDLSYPLALSFQARAFQVQEIASNVGLGWDLVGISSISRTINGQPDNYDGTGDKEKDMFIITLRGEHVRFYFSDTNQPTVLDNKPYKVTKVPLNDSDYWIVKDDLGNQYVFGNTPESIEQVSLINKTTIDSLTDRRAPHERTVSIPYDDPIFDISFPNFKEIIGDSVRFEKVKIIYDNVPATWYLTKIIDANGISEINFLYEKGSNNLDINYYNISYTLSNLLEGKYRTGVKVPLLGIQIVKPKISHKNEYIKNRFYTISNTNVNASYLKEIRYSHFVVTFDYSNREDLKYGRKLDKINIQQDNSLLRKFEFKYYYTNSSNRSLDPIPPLSFKNFLTEEQTLLESKRLMLQKIVLDDVLEVIDNTYNTSTILPPRYSQHIDDHGYFVYNHSSHDIRDEKYGPQIVDTTTVTPQYLSTFYTFYKKPSFHQTKANTLESINHITGGRTLFSYEPNIAVIKTDSIISGGLRVRTIVQDYGSERDTIVFKYSKNFQYNVLPLYQRSLAYRGETMPAIGFIEPGNKYLYNEAIDQMQKIETRNMLVYDAFGQGNTNMNQNNYVEDIVAAARTLYNGLRWHKTPVISDATLVSINSLNRSFVVQTPSYEEVKTIYQHKGYTISKYTGFGRFSDPINTDAYFVKNLQKNLSITYENIFRANDDFSSLRNQIIEERQYAYDGRLLMKNKYKYKIILLDSIKSIYSEPLDYHGDIYNSASKLYNFKIYNIFPQIDSVESVHFAYTDTHIDSIESRSRFKFSQDYPYLVSSKFIKENSGSELETNYFYPFDMNGGIVENEMTSKNMLNYPIETLIRKNADILTGTFNEYQKSNNAILSTAVYKLKSEFPINSNSFVAGASGTKDSRYKLEVSRAFDQYGNVNQETFLDGSSISTLWGYEGRFPIARVLGETQSNIAAAMGTASADVISAFNNFYVSDSYIHTQVENLRTSLPHTSIESYSYSPFKGITGQTDARGISEWYEYDILGRLKLIKDFQGNIVKSFCYNYKNQLIDCEGNRIFVSEAVSRKFYKQGCGELYYGSEVLYEIPKGKYTSTLSQSDANSQAYNEVNMYGQSYANEHGECRSSGVYVALCDGNWRTVQNGDFREMYAIYTIHVFSDPEGKNILNHPVKIKFLKGKSSNELTVHGNYSFGEVMVERQRVWPTPPEGQEYEIESSTVELMFDPVYQIIDLTDCSLDLEDPSGPGLDIRLVEGVNPMVFFSQLSSVCSYIAGTEVDISLLYYKFSFGDAIRCFADGAFVAAVADGYYTPFKNMGNEPNFWYKVIEGRVVETGVCGLSPVFYSNYMSQSFFKDCIYGQGTEVVYIVPSGKYTSQVSQADADRQAQEEMLMRGQLNANDKGNCPDEGTYVSICNSGNIIEGSDWYEDIIGNFVIRVFADSRGTVLKQTPEIVKIKHRGITHTYTVTGSLHIGQLVLIRRQTGLPPYEVEDLPVEGEKYPITIVSSQTQIQLPGCGDDIDRPHTSLQEGQYTMISFSNLGEVCSYDGEELETLSTVFVGYNSSLQTVVYTDNTRTDVVSDGYYTLGGVVDSTRPFFIVESGVIVNSGLCQE